MRPRLLPQSLETPMDLALLPGPTSQEKRWARCACVSSARCFYCGDTLQSRHQHDHMPVPWRCGGREVVGVCVTCHEMKEAWAFNKWPRAALLSVVTGLTPGAGALCVFIASALADPERADFDYLLDRDAALDTIASCTTMDARIFVARTIAAAYEAKGRFNRD